MCKDTAINQANQSSLKKLSYATLLVIVLPEVAILTFIALFGNREFSGFGFLGLLLFLLPLLVIGLFLSVYNIVWVVRNASSIFSKSSSSLVFVAVVALASVAFLAGTIWYLLGLITG